MELSQTSATLSIEETLNLTATITPENTSDRTITWTSSDTDVATVENGVVTTKWIGNATITATTNDGSNKFATCNITVAVNEAEWDLNKVTKVQSTDSTPITVPVPKGFTVSSVSTESTVAEGLVIYEGIDAVTTDNLEAAKTSRNQFVWVPITESNPMFNVITETDGTTRNVGQLYNFGNYNSATNTFISKTLPEKIEYTLNNFNEPNILTDPTIGDVVEGDETKGIERLKNVVGITGADNNTILTNWRKELQTNFDKIKQSVITYGGFWIGRYETGNLIATKDVAPVVVKNNSNIASINWYYMYQNSKSIVQNVNAKNAGIESGMIWGNQWDATLNWFLTSSNQNVKKYVTDSISKGNYLETNENKSISTGLNDDYQANNIYDMAGNVWDWTLESFGERSRTVRGGDYEYSGSSRPASDRGSGLQYSSGSGFGTRSILII